MFTKTILSILLISIAQVNYKISIKTIMNKISREIVHGEQFQTSWAKPKPVEDLCLIKSKYPEYLAPSENYNSLPPSDQLFIFVSIAMEKIIQKYVQGGKAVSEQLLKNDEIKNAKSGKVWQFKQNLTKFEEDYAKCDGIDELSDLSDLYSYTTTVYFEDDETTFDADSKLILGLLRKYKSDDLEREIEKIFDVFMDDFYKKYESLKGDLAKEEDKFSKQISDWFANFKTLKSYDDKFDAIDQFTKF